jgi:hypothetical protein
MSTDRELLEAAAKAADIQIDSWHFAYAPGPYTQEFAVIKETLVWWNPLIDDGDALRLAVKLGITIDVHLERVRAYVDELPRSVEEFFGADHYAATRRAIVRAAAAMAVNEQKAAA